MIFDIPEIRANIFTFLRSPNQRPKYDYNYNIDMIFNSITSITDLYALVLFYDEGIYQYYNHISNNEMT
jgi:hypothetical protein